MISDMGDDRYAPVSPEENDILSSYHSSGEENGLIGKLKRRTTGTRACLREHKTLLCNIVSMFVVGVVVWWILSFVGIF